MSADDTNIPLAEWSWPSDATNGVTITSAKKIATSRNGRTELYVIRARRTDGAEFWRWGFAVLRGDGRWKPGMQLITADAETFVDALIDGLEELDRAKAAAREKHRTVNAKVEIMRARQKHLPMPDLKSGRRGGRRDR